LEKQKLTQALQQAKLQLEQQTEAREGRQLTAGLIPASLSPTGAETTPGVAQALREKKPKYAKAGEAEEAGKKFIIFAQENDPTKTVRIPAGAAGADQKLTARQQDHLGKLSGAENLVKNVRETLKDLPAGGPGLIQEALSSDIVLRGAAAIPEARLYNQVTPGASVGVYRAVTRDDRLSDADAASRARPLFPFLGETSEVRELKLQFLEQLIEDQKSGTMLGGNADPNAIVRAIFEQKKFVKKNLGMTAKPGGRSFKILRVERVQ
jgi:hypothetical protein